MNNRNRRVKIRIVMFSKNKTAFAMFIMTSLVIMPLWGQQAEKKEKKQTEKKPAKSAREKLLSDSDLLFFVPFDSSVDVERPYDKAGSLNGEGKHVSGVMKNCLSLPAKDK